MISHSNYRRVILVVTFSIDLQDVAKQQRKNSQDILPVFKVISDTFIEIMMTGSGQGLGKDWVTCTQDFSILFLTNACAFAIASK
jgi:hypothetical protein